jgi:UDP-glucose 4-epimerase
MKKIIITGSAGMFGANFARYFLEQGYTVMGLDNFSGGYGDFLPEHENFQFVEIDLIDSERLNKMFDDFKADTVYHFAAYAAEGLSPFIRNFNYTNNVICSMNVINACIRTSAKIVFTSSMAVYGHQQVPFIESSVPTPADPYGIAKYTVEMDLREAANQFDLRYTIIRPHNVIGLYQNIWDRYRNVIGIFINKALSGNPLTIYGDGKQTRAFSDISSCFKTFEKIGYDKFNGEIFNIGSDKFYTINEAAKVVGEVAKGHGYNHDIIHLEERLEVKDAYPSHDKAKSFLNFNDKTDFPKLVESMFTWALTQPHREIKNMEYEIGNGIYSFWK